ncbi:prephenate dehydrogenase/arogenate dehydrogenase family protein [Roseococcus sp. YIM B11640]|uniref:prephenate dehydrogenase/arogenate dehydrogenase family protein n=1 Tax=Roseococcus sp. YIM B11640 TaxID=3133973 RepID=UPI003C79CA21
MFPASNQPRIGIIGFGAFGRLMAQHLRPHFPLCAHDPDLGAAMEGVARVSLQDAAACPIIVLATPVGALAEVVESIAPHLAPGALVLDVGSVKSIPAEIMRRGLPAHVEIVATHPLFGPQSARDGIRGLKIAVCPVRGPRAPRVAAFLRRVLGLDAILTTPEAHDREAAMAQGLTHLIAKLLMRMEPLPTRMTTRSFDLIMQAVGMVRDDAPGVSRAIEHANPFAPEVRRRFLALAAEAEFSAVDGAPAPRPNAAISREKPTWQDVWRESVPS